MSRSEPQLPTYGQPVPTRADRMPWPRVVARMILVILPGLLVGTFAGGVIVTVVGVQVIRSTPAVTLIIPVLAGLITGLGLGLLLKPIRDQLWSFALVALGIAAVAEMLLLLLARLRVGGAATSTTVLGYLLGVLIIVVVQTAVCVPFWLRRLRNS